VIRRAIDDRPHRIDVSYGSRTGVPSLMSVDQDAMALDDVGGFSVKGFRRVAAR